LEYQTFSFFPGQLKHEIFGESGLITLYRLVKVARRHTIESRQLRIEHDSLAAN